jgi:hypothetical protein
MTTGTIFKMRMCPPTSVFFAKNTKVMLMSDAYSKTRPFSYGTVTKYTLPEDTEEKDVTAPDVTYDIEVQEKFLQNYMIGPEDSYLQTMLILDEIDIEEYTEVTNAVKEARALRNWNEATDMISAEFNAFSAVPITKAEFMDLDCSNHLPEILSNLQGRLRVMIDRTNVNTVKRQESKRSLALNMKAPVITEDVKVFVRL